MFFNQIVNQWAARAVIFLLLGLITQIMRSLEDGSLCSAQWIADGKPDPRNASGNLTVFSFHVESAS